MAKVKLLNLDGKQVWYFFCPGCKCGHYFDKRWYFNNDVNKPTFNPSLLCYNKYNCHSFVRNGKIEFLSDCKHELAGKIIELPEVD